jgi:hypothetical protein
MAMKEGKDGRIHENPESIMTRRSALLSAIGAGIALAAAPQDALAAPAKAKETVLVVGAKGAIGREVNSRLNISRHCCLESLAQKSTNSPLGPSWTRDRGSETGHPSSQVILALQAKGCDVVGLTRFKDDVPTDFPDGVKWVQAGALPPTHPRDFASACFLFATCN